MLMVWFIDEDMKFAHTIATGSEIAGGLHVGIG